MPPFTPPYPLTWESPITQSGSPSIGVHGSVNGRRLFFGMSTNGTKPSSAFLITSFGMDAGAPTRAGLRLLIDTTLDFTGFFYSSGSFASALTSAVVKLYVEESDPAGNFLRGMNVGEMIIRRENPAWWYGSQSWPESGREFAIPFSPLATVRNNNYRVYVDLYGEIRAAGYGGLGGSYAHADCSVNVRQVRLDFG